MNHFHRLALAATVAAGLLAGCSSGVRLDQGAQVVDRSATAVAPPAAPGVTTASAPQTQVAAVSAIPPAGPAAAPASPAAAPASVGRVVYFDYDSFVIKPEFQAVVEGHARFLRANPGRKIAIEGHTDERGGREYNLALGQKRAEAVRRALGLLGVSDAQMEAVSLGEEKPANAAATEAAFAENRRAEIVYR